MGSELFREVVLDPPRTTAVGRGDRKERLEPKEGREGEGSTERGQVRKRRSERRGRTAVNAPGPTWSDGEPGRPPRGEAPALWAPGGASCRPAPLSQCPRGSRTFQPRDGFQSSCQPPASAIRDSGPPGARSAPSLLLCQHHARGPGAQVSTACWEVSPPDVPVGFHGDRAGLLPSVRLSPGRRHAQADQTSRVKQHRKHRTWPISNRTCGRPAVSPADPSAMGQAAASCPTERGRWSACRAQGQQVGFGL